MRIVRNGILLLAATCSFCAASEVLPEFEDMGQLEGLNRDLPPEDMDALQFIHNAGPYQPEKNYGLAHNVFFIAAGNQKIAEKILGIVDDPFYQNHWADAYHALGMMASVEPSRVNYDRLTQAVAKIEENEALNKKVVLRTIGKGYIAISRFGNEQSLSFFKPRMQPEFWKDKRDLGRKIHYHDMPEHEEDVSPVATAVLKFNTLGEPGGIELLHSLIKDVISEDESVARAYDTVKNISARHRELHQADLATYRKWKPKFNNVSAGDSAQNLAETPSDHSAPEVKKEAQESTAPEPTTEKPAEVDTPEPSEEPAEQSSSWWLWLIGAVVVVSGIGLIARRKK